MEVRKLIIGVDPGKDGAIAVSGVVIQKITIPKIKTEVDTRELARIFKGFGELDREVTIILEDVHSIFGASAKSNFSFGKICGMLEGLCNAFGYRYIKVQPKVWQKAMHEGIPLITKPAKKEGGKPTKDTKAMSLMAAKRLWPGEAFVKSTRASNPHDGIVDALLMMEYGRRVYG